MRYMKKKKGISLIVLIITIIVIIILAAAIILTITKNNPMSSAKEATFKTDIRNFQDSLAMYIGKEVSVDYYGNREKITVIDNLDDMDKYISGYNKKKYSDKLGIEDDELVYFPDKVTKDEKKWLDDLGIKPYSVYIPEAGEECFQWDSNNRIVGYYDDKLREFLKTTNGVLKIPKRCTVLGYRCFLDNDYIENVIMQDGIKDISSQVFRNCSNLRSVYISKSVQSLSGEYTYENCENLERIEVDSENKNWSSQDGVLYNKAKTILISAPGKIEECNIPSTVKTIGDYAFASCKNLKKVVFPEGLEIINMYSFDRCESLSQVNLPSTLKRIDIYAFYSIAISGELVIPDSVESIGNGNFSHCKNISKVIIGSSLKTIGYAAFEFSSNLKEFEVKSDNKYFSSQDGILYNKDKTTLLLLPEGFVANDFSIISGVKNVSKLSGNLTGTLYIPSSVSNISSLPSGINRINVDENNLTYSSQDGILYNKDKTEVIKCPAGLNVNNLSLPDSVKIIGRDAFDDCKGITGNLKLGNGVEIIKDRAFYGCYNISGTVIIPESVINMGYSVFFQCNKIDSIKCRAPSKPDGWDNNWNQCCNANVVWGYTGD